MSTAAVAIAAGVVGSVQSADMFDASGTHSCMLFREQIDIASARHTARCEQSERHFASHAQHARELFDQTTSQQDALATKEGMRDYWQQRNEVCQARMITATVMFGCCFGTLTDGFPNLNFTTSDDLQGTRGAIIIVSLLWGVGVSVLLLSLLVTLMLYRRLSRYDVDHPLTRYKTCGHAHREFWSYFACQCQALDDASLTLTYIGAILTAGSVVALCAVKYRAIYNALWEVEPVLIALMGLGYGSVTVAHFYWPDDTTKLKR